MIQNATGVKPRYLRPPYGAMNATLQRHIEEKYGMTFIYWSVDPLDWKVRDSNAVYDQIMRQVRPGASSSPTTSTPPRWRPCRG